MKALIHLFLALNGLLICSFAEAQTKQEQVDSLINAYFRYGCFDGVVLVAEKGEIILKKAYGVADRELLVPMRANMKFKIGSISKPFTALLILQLVEEGIIRLDGKITDYIPDYKGKKGDSISIEQLLTHTSGILQNLDPEKEAVQEKLYHSLRDMLAYIEESDLYFEPGTGFHYSNLAYNLLAYIAETICNKPFYQLLTERIFEPLDMNNTKQYSAVSIEKNLSKGYEYKLLSGYENASYYDPSYAVGNGGLISTVDDLSKFDESLYRGQLISKDLYYRMITPTKFGAYGYGWQISEKITTNSQDTIRIMSHAGSINGFGTYLSRIESDSILVIVLKNSRADTYISPAYAPVIGQEIISILLDEEIQLPRRSIAREMGFIIGQEGIDRAIEEYYRIKTTDSEEVNYDESELNNLGIELFFRFNKVNEALRVFEVNMHEFPYSYNTYDSYAYALMKVGEYEKSVEIYKEGLKVFEKYPELNYPYREYAKDAQVNISKMEAQFPGIN